MAEGILPAQSDSVPWDFNPLSESDDEGLHQISRRGTDLVSWLLHDFHDTWKRNFYDEADILDADLRVQWFWVYWTRLVV